MDITKTLALIGKSGHGKVIEDIAYANGYTDILWVDDNPDKAPINVATFIREYSQLNAVIAIGDNIIRKKIYTLLKSHDISMPSLIHPSAIISPSAKISDACVIMPLVVINANTTIQNACIINSAAVIEHDNHIASFVHISPKVALAGDVSVEELTHIGIGSSVIQGIHIGKNSVVAAGSVIIKNVPNDVMVAGVPAQIKKELK